MANIYLAKSCSYNLLNEKLDSILEGVDSISSFSLMDVTLDDVLEDAGYYGMFGERRAIIVKNSKYFEGRYLYEEETKRLSAFFKNMPDDLIIIFICNEIKKDKEITKNAIDCGAQIIDIPIPDEPTLLSLIKIYCQNNGISIEQKAINKIINNTGGVYDFKKNPTGSNYDIIIKELEKLSLYNNGIITEEIVDNCAVKLETVTTLDLSNAVIAKNFNKAFSLLDELIKEGIEGPAIIGLLASSFVNMYMVKDAEKHGLSEDDIARVLGYSNPYRVTMLKRNGRIYTLEELSDIIHSLYELDKKIKTGYNPVYGLKEFLLDL